MPVADAPVVAVTPGEPAGVGPDICLELARGRPPVRLVVIADRNMLAERARLLRMDIELVDFAAGRLDASGGGRLSVCHVPAPATVTPGDLDKANSRYVLRTLEVAIDGCLDGRFDAMTTGPVNKAVINDAGLPFTGHTEFLAARCGVAHVVMMLVGGGMRVALATTHLALREVARAITAESLTKTLEVLHADLVGRFGIAAPRLLVAGLNPHAGESGHLGREEIDVIAPVLDRLRQRGFDLEGPLPADTLFNPQRLSRADAVLAMYHDQGLPVLKHASFGGGVNVTLGLPLIRTSVDHGTALDLAGSGRADCGSLVAAITLAAELASNASRACANTRVGT
jgi:4-hydroxythreonine-4-phosphate dehydrogenase